MRKKYFILLITFSISLIGLSQNLVPNGDFENYTSLPTFVGEWYRCVGWSNVNGNQTLAPYASPDYLHTSGSGYAALPNSVFATVNPFSGNAIMGFDARESTVPDFREYLAVQLTSPLIIGETYTVSFVITNGISNQICGNSSNHIGIRFSASPLTQITHEPIGGTPQLEIAGELWTTSWQTISFTYTADSAYNYITIGNFYNDASTSSSVHINTSYESAYYFIDDVAVSPVSSFVPVNDIILQMPNVFSPNSDGENDYFVPVEMEGVSNATLSVYNRWGQKLIETSDLQIGWDGKYNSKYCDAGTYFWTVNYTTVANESKTLNGFLTLTK